MLSCGDTVMPSLHSASQATSITQADERPAEVLQKPDKSSANVVQISHMYGSPLYMGPDTLLTDMRLLDRTPRA